jgi:hypothetical protein
METEIKNIISSFDKVFEQLGQKPLLENPAFQIDNEMKADHFLRFNSVEKDRRIKMMFEIVTDRLTFWLDRTNEIPEWSIEFIKEKKDEVERELRLLFESEILVEYKGKRTRIILLDKSGVELRRFSYYQGLFINWFSSTTRKTYKPYFEI